MNGFEFARKSAITERNANGVRKNLDEGARELPDDAGDGNDGEFRPLIGWTLFRPRTVPVITAANEQGAGRKTKKKAESERMTEHTSGSESSTSVLSNSMACHTPIRARVFFLKFSRARMLYATVCFSVHEKNQAG